MHKRIILGSVLVVVLCAGLAVFGELPQTDVSAATVSADGDGAIEAAVTDEDGNALEGATVELYLDGDSMPLREATTNSEGRVYFGELAVGSNESNKIEYRVRADHETATEPTERQAELYEPTQTQDSVQLFLETESEPAQITGDVINENDELLPGADIEVTNTNTGEVAATTQTGSDGAYAVTDLEAEQDYRVEATYDGETAYTELSDTTPGTNNADVVISGVSPPSPAEFEVDITSTNAPVDAGDTLEIGFSVENVGDESATQTIDIDAETVGSTTTDITLDGGDSTTETVTLSTESGDAGTHTVTAQSADDSASTSIQIEEPSADAFFEVQDVETDAPVEAGTPLSVTFVIENTGDQTATQTIDIDAETVGSTTTDITLDGGDSTTETVTLSTESGDAGTYTVTAQSADDSASETAQIEEQSEPAQIAGDVVNENDEALPDADIEVINTNTGDVVGTAQTNSDGTYAVTGLESGQDYRVEATYDGETGYTELSDIPWGTNTADVVISGVSPPSSEAVFEVQDIETDAPIEAGEQLSVAVEITNTGGQTATQTIEITVESVGSITREVTLDEGESIFRTYGISTTSGDAGTHTVTAQSADDSTSETAQIEAQSADAFFEIQSIESNAPIESGSDLEFTVDIENTGEQTASQAIEIAVGSVGSAGLNLSLEGGESVSRTVSISTASGDAGTHTATVQSEDDSASQTVQIESSENGGFQIQDIDSNTPIEPGDELELAVEIENTGDEILTQSIDIVVDSVVSTTREVTIGAGASTTETITLSTASDDIGTHTVTVHSEDDSASHTIQIQEQADEAVFDIQGIEVNTPLEAGQELEFAVTVVNSGDQAGTKNVQITVGRLGSKTETVTLEGGESTTQTVTLSTSSGDAGTYTVTAQSEDDSTSETIQIDEQSGSAVFEIQSIEPNTPIEPGDVIELTIELENTGDETATQTIEIETEAFGETTETVTLNDGESKRETVTIPTSSNAGGEYTITVSSADDTVSNDVEVVSPAQFDVDAITIQNTSAGEQLTVVAAIENTGDRSDTQTVELSIGNLGTTSKTVSLEAGESTETALTLPTDTDSSGDYEGTITTEDDDTTEQITVFEPSDGSETPTPGEDSDEDMGAVGAGSAEGDKQNTDDGTADDQQEPGDDTGTASDQQDGSEDTGTAGDRQDEAGIDSAGSSDQTTDGSQFELPVLALAGSGGGVLLLFGAYALVSGTRRTETDPADEPTEREQADSSTDAPDGQVSNAPTDTAGDNTHQQHRPQEGSTDGVPQQIPDTQRLSVSYDTITKGDPLGRGGNADVFHATAPTENGTVTLAIKEPRMGGTLHTERADRLLQEAEMWQQLDDHENIVGVVDYGAEPLPWIAMEYMDSGHLGDRQTEMDTPQKLWTALSITEAVCHAHQHGVAHLDLKPENILFRNAADGWPVPKVADWGLSKHLLEHSKSRDGMTVEYAAPEQFQEDASTNTKTDVYQLGAVYYELFTGQPLFEGEMFSVMKQIETETPTPPSEIADVPPRLDEILLKALAKDPAERYDDSLYLRDELKSLFEDYR